MQGDDRAHGMAADPKASLIETSGVRHLVERVQLGFQRERCGLLRTEAAETQQIGHRDAPALTEMIEAGAEHLAGGDEAVNQNDRIRARAEEPNRERPRPCSLPLAGAPPPHRGRGEMTQGPPGGGRTC
jgi:hypothetical protein